MKRHGSCLMSLLEKPFTNRWGKYREDLEQPMALAIDSYAQYLVTCNKSQAARQADRNPAKELQKNVYIKHFDKAADSDTVSATYSKLEQALLNMPPYQTVLFDEKVHLSKPFGSRMERVRYFDNLQCRFPVQMLRFVLLNYLFIHYFYTLLRNESF